MSEWRFIPLFTWRESAEDERTRRERAQKTLRERLSGATDSETTIELGKTSGGAGDWARYVDRHHPKLNADERAHQIKRSASLAGYPNFNREVLREFFRELERTTPFQTPVDK